MNKPRVEFDDIQPASHYDVAKHFAVLSFQDIGLNDKLGEAYYMRFNIFDGRLVGMVPVLRTFSAQDDLVLSQVLSHQFAPRMGLSALVSPTGEVLARNERSIVIKSFRQATQNLRRPDAA
jgi:hypothetical protein